MLTRAQFAACYDQGARFFSKNFVVFARLEPFNEPAWKLGTAVTKKLGHAPDRNRIKRVLREFIRLHQELLPRHLRLVIVPKRHVRAGHICLHAVEHDLLPVISRLSSLSPAPLSAQAADGDLNESI